MKCACMWQYVHITPSSRWPTQEYFCPLYTCTFIPKKCVLYIAQLSHLHFIYVCMPVFAVLCNTGKCNLFLSPLLAMVPTVPPSLLPSTAPARLLAANLSPNLTLSCTVAGEGRFSWQWTDPDGNPPSAVILSNVTRTSIATFTNIRGTGDGTLERNLTFTCTATYNPLVSGVERNNVSQEITVVAIVQGKSTELMVFVRLRFL